MSTIPRDSRAAGFYFMAESAPDATARREALVTMACALYAAHPFSPRACREALFASLDVADWGDVATALEDLATSFRERAQAAEDLAEILKAGPL